MNPLETIFIDRAIDEINAFHRDERKAQVKTLRQEAKLVAKGTVGAASLTEDPATWVADKAREYAREFLRAEYSPEVVDRRRSLEA